jgi:hypothetical protein
MGIKIIKNKGLQNKKYEIELNETFLEVQIAGNKLLYAIVY